MTSRAWLLAIAAALAGLIAALTWPSGPEQRRIVVGERQLLGIDLQVFETVCAQIEKDRTDFETGAGGAELPQGLTMGEFAITISNAPERLEGTCGRAGVRLEEFLQIVSMMDKVGIAAQRLRQWNETFEQRLTDAETVAKALEEVGKEPPPLPTPETKPVWYGDLTREVRDSVPIWNEIGAPATAAWAKAMRLKVPEPQDDNPK